MSFFSHYIRVCVIIHHRVTLGQQPPRHWFWANDLLAAALSVRWLLQQSQTFLLHLRPFYITSGRLPVRTRSTVVRCAPLARSLAILSTSRDFMQVMISVREGADASGMAAIREMRERAGVKRGVKEADEDTEKKKKVRLPLFLWRCGWEAVVVLRLFKVRLSRGKTASCWRPSCAPHPIYTCAFCSFRVVRPPGTIW